MLGLWEYFWSSLAWTTPTINVVANDILMDIGYALLEPVINTRLNPSGGNVAVGIQAVTPGSMAGIYVGAMLVVGSNGSAIQEVVTVISVTASTFTATFTKPHPPTEPIATCTFPSGQPDNTLFSQSEILGYMADSQNDFLLKVRPIYAVGTVALTVGKKVYPAPADSIRIERASIVNTASTPPSAVELYNTTQTDLDWDDASWANTLTGGPNSWYQDQVNFQTIGVGPPPQVGNNLTVFYSQKATAPLGLLSTFLIPDPMTCAIKWRTISMCFSKNGETKDPQKAAFAEQMYGILVLASSKFMDGVQTAFKAPEETIDPVVSGKRF